MPKAYPAYFGEYRQFTCVRAYLDEFHNLYSIGRNGMHRYNNQDHSMLSAKCAVDSIITGGGAKARIWDINADGELSRGKRAGAHPPAPRDKICQLLTLRVTCRLRAATVLCQASSMTAGI